jgi:undecaprenyl-diphosphatase
VTKLKPRRVRNFFLPVIFLALLASLASGQTGVERPKPDAPAPAAELSVGDAIVLGVVEGVTEFLPVSSTGHLIIASRALGLESDTPLRGHDGQPLWYHKPSEKNPAGEPLTLKLAADTFNVVIQFGAIAAVALLYWPQLVSLVMGLLGRDPAGRRLLINLIIAFIPAAVIGLALKNWIDAKLFGVGPVIVAQLAGAGLMLFAESWRRRHFKVRASDDGLEHMPSHHAAGIGALQVLALWPGMSRSMTTIVGGYFCGLEPKRAAEFSFLLGFLTLTAATGLKSVTHGAAMIQVFGWSHVLLGCVVAAVVAALCVRWLVGWLTRHGLAAFAWYRIAMAIALTIAFYL